MVSLSNCILRTLNDSGEEVTFAVVFSKHIKVTNTLSAYVKYFKLEHGKSSVTVYKEDREFYCPVPYLLENYQIMIKTKPSYEWERLALYVQKNNNSAKRAQRTSR